MNWRTVESFPRGVLWHRQAGTVPLTTVCDRLVTATTALHRNDLIADKTGAKAPDHCKLRGLLSFCQAKPSPSSSSPNHAVAPREAGSRGTTPRPWMVQQPDRQVCPGRTGLSVIIRTLCASLPRRPVTTVGTPMVHGHY